ncbi:hypothetical protein [Corynebacterium sp.]|uniref:hypothetical protein n=1 Tax=Corynebacterium sp. TaxID=1720 RepID=UPI0028B12CD5|nr:hypothetical protein [Corynebacterium sp.]
MASALALFAAWPVFRAGDRFRPLPTPVGTVFNSDVNPDADVGSDPVVYVNGTRFDGPLNSLALSVAVRQQV